MDEDVVIYAHLTCEYELAGSGYGISDEYYGLEDHEIIEKLDNFKAWKEL